jgi:hypothetical protein
MLVVEKGRSFQVINWSISVCGLKGDAVEAESRTIPTNSTLIVTLAFYLHVPISGITDLGQTSN